jgi:protein required for attachment to host cells
MDGAWIVSANSGRAQIFSQGKPSEPLKEVHDMANPAVRLRTADTEPDKIAPTSATKSSHNVGAATPNKTYQPNQMPDERAAEEFARDIARFLLKGRQEGAFGKLVLVASPEFLGVLRKQLDPQLELATSLEINKDYTQMNATQLREQILAHMGKS